MTETWTSDECAQAWGVKTPTWLGYVSRQQAPQPLPDVDDQGRRLWDADAVRAWPRPGAGRSRAGASVTATALLAEMERIAAQMQSLRAEQRALLTAGAEQGLEVSSMARASGVSRQTAYSWLRA